MKRTKHKCPICGSDEITLHEVYTSGRIVDAKTGKVLERMRLRDSEFMGEYFQCRGCGIMTETVEEECDWLQTENQ